MTIGIFGGSFDPPHICHVLVCQYSMAMGHVDRVLVIPTFSHPFDKNQTPYADRLAMCRLAMQGFSDIEVSDIESRRDGYSYTIDTVRELISQMPGERFRLIIGSDILQETERWKEYPELTRLAPPLIVPRGEPLPGGQDLFVFPPLSSTQIRESIRRGEDVSAAIQPQVLAYAMERDLYGIGG